MNDADLQRASEMWFSGFSVMFIARHLGVTKGVVSGYAQRNRGLFPERAKKKPSVRLDLNQKSEGFEVIKIEQPPQKVKPPEGAKHKPWSELESGECQWHMDDGVENFFNPPSHEFPCCGLPTEGASRFCQYHARKAVKDG